MLACMHTPKLIAVDIGNASQARLGTCTYIQQLHASRSFLGLLQTIDMIQSMGAVVVRGNQDDKALAAYVQWKKGKALVSQFDLLIQPRPHLCYKVSLHLQGARGYFCTRGVGDTLIKKVVSQ